MVPHLLGAKVSEQRLLNNALQLVHRTLLINALCINEKAPDYVWNMLDVSHGDEQLLRVVSLLANLICTTHKRRIDPTLDLLLDDKAAEEDSL